jgi:hypothetical protein
VRARLLGLDYLAQPVSRPVVSSACNRSLGGASAQARRVWPEYRVVVVTTNFRIGPMQILDFENLGVFTSMARTR